MALLEVRSLSKSFGGIHAVDRCSFAVPPGSITALIGPNGAGKTTVFNLISGLHKPDGGAILFDGARIDGLPPIGLPVKASRARSRSAVTSPGYRCSRT